MATPRPTKDDIRALLEWAGGSFTTLPYQLPTTTDAVNVPLVARVTGGFWAQFWIEVLEDLRFWRQQIADYLTGDQVTSFPKGFPLRIPPTAPAKVASAADQVNVGDPQIKVTIPEGVKSDEERARLTRLYERFGRGLIQQEERDSDTSPLREQSQNTIALGLGGRSVMLDLSLWPKRPKKRPYESAEKHQEKLDEWNKARRSQSPFVMRSIHPLNFFYDRAHTPPRWVILQEPSNPWDIRADYPNWSDPQSRFKQPPGAAVQPVVKITYMTPDWMAIYADGENLLGTKEKAGPDGVAPNPYKRVMLWPSAGGSGHQDPLGRPEFELAGIIRHNKGVLLVEASIFNQEEVYRQRVSLGPKIIVSGPDAKERIRIAAQVLSSPLKAVDAPPGYTVSEIHPSTMPPVLTDQRAQVREDIDRGMVYDVASGAGNPTEPAARTRIRLFQIDKRFAAAVLNIQQTLEASLIAALYTVRDVLKEPVGVNVALTGLPAEYVDLKPEDIVDGVVFEVNLIGDSEEEKARRIQEGMARLTSQPPTLDLEHFMRDYARDVDVEGILSGIEADAIRIQAIIPGIVALFQGQMKQVVLEALQEAGIDPMEVAAEAAQAGMQGGGAVPPSQPGGTAGAPGAASAPGAPGGIAVGANGASLPGLPGLVPAEGDNAGVARPNSPEALAQTLQRGLQPVGGPPLRRVP